MDPHFLLDIFTLCSVASLDVILILTKALKRRRLALSHQTKWKIFQEVVSETNKFRI